MNGRKKTQNKIQVKKSAKAFVVPAAKSAARQKHDLRFGVSLVLLIGFLSFATYLFLFALIGSQRANSAAVLKKPAAGMNKAAKQSANARKLSDESLGYTLAFPASFGEWMYKTGYVVSPVDETLTNQYAKVYVPLPSRSASSNFEEKYFGVFTVRKFSEKEWDALEKGCAKGNLLYCEQKGTKINEKDKAVYAYTVSEKCPQELLSKCKLVQGIVKSFKLD